MLQAMDTMTTDSRITVVFLSVDFPLLAAFYQYTNREEDLRFYYMITELVTYLGLVLQVERLQHRNPSFMSEFGVCFFFV